MNTFLLILIVAMTFIILVSTIITTVITVKSSKDGKEVLRKALIVSGIVLAVAALIGLAIGVSSIKKDDTKEPEAVTLETAGFNAITLDEYTNLLNGTDKSIILVARPSCGYCAKFTPILKEAADDYNLTINYLNTDNFTQEDWTSFQGSNEYLSGSEWGTPLTIIVQNGTFVDYNNGYVELDAIKEFFTKNGLGE